MSRGKKKSDYPELLIKAVVVGDSMVGKTWLVSRFGGFDGECPVETTSTIGIDFKMREVTRRNMPIKVQMWDTAGQEIFRSIGVAYYRKANALILVFDVTRRTSFENVTYWMGELTSHCEKGIPICIVANKCDQPRVVTHEEGSSLAFDHGCEYYEVSAKTGSGVEGCFANIIDQVLSTQEQDLIKQSEVSNKFTPSSTIPEKKSCIERFVKAFSFW